VGEPIVLDKDEATVGRDPANDVVVPEGSVSRRHARLVRRGEAWAVVDQGSANGTFINSQRVTDSALKTGQELRFGGMPYMVEIEGAPAEAAAPGAGRDADVTVMQSTPLAPPPPAAPPAAPPLPHTAAYAVPSAPRATPPAPKPPAPPPLPPARPAASAAAAPPVSAPPPAKKGRGPLFWIGLGCGGCLTMIAGCAVLLGGGFYFTTRGPLEAVSDHVAKIRAGDVAGAYAQFSEEHRSRVSQEEFQALVDAHTTLKDNAEAGVWPPAGSFSRVNDRAVVRARLVSKSGNRETLVCELVQEGGAWRIASLAVEPGS
jgi:hypothetical protein